MAVKLYFSKHKLLFLIICAITFPLTGFTQIQGTIHDKNNQPLSFANILLINQKDSSLVTGLMSTDVGTFSITNFNPGKYLIRTSMVGYKSTLSQPFEIKSSKDHIHIQPMVAEEDSKLLENIDIVAKKPIYEQQIDRLVVNVDKSITSVGGTALDVLEKSPGVIVNRQNKTVSLGGKEGIIVMINGKESQMPLAAAIEMLSSMSAENIKKIELITTPPSKYSAEGDAGIINIILKKDDDFGTNGTYALGVGMGVNGKENGNITLNHHVKKVNYFGMYSFSHDRSYQTIGNDRFVTQNGSTTETNSESLRNPFTNFHNARIGLDYTVSSKTIIGLLGTGYMRDWEMNAMSNIFHKQDNQVDNLINQAVVESNKWNNYTGNFNLQHFFKEDEILNFNADYLHYDDNNPSGYLINYHDKNNTLTSTEGIRVTKKTPINTIVGKLDYSKNFGHDIKLETGLKYTNTGFENDVSVANQVADVWTFNSDLTNKYALHEDISAVYSSLNFKPNPKTSVIAGLRYEYTNTVLNTIAQHGIIDRHYGELFPTMFLSHELNKSNTIQFSYSRRITRPSFNELAPFIFFQSPDTYMAGNEKLQPSNSDILKTDYRYKTFLFSLTYTIENNAIRRFQPRQDTVKNILYMLSRNLDKVTTTSFMVSFPLNITGWWNVQNNFNGVIQNVKTLYDGQQLDLTVKNFNVNIINNFRISKRIQGEIAGYYESPSLWGVYTSGSITSISFGLQLKSRNENNTFSLNLSDAFLTSIWHLSANIPELNIKSSAILNFEPRVLRFTYAHTFGNNKLKKERKRETGSDEERKRVD